MRLVLPVLLFTLGVAGCFAAETLDLNGGLNSGLLWAEFHGAGDRAVTGTIGRTSDEPLTVTIAPGTQFWAQAGGRQGQATVGEVPVDLTGRRVATVTIHTCCTDLGLPAATAADAMVLVGLPNAAAVRLLSLPRVPDQPHMAVQAAVWALSSDPTRAAVRRVLYAELPRGTSPSERTRFATEMLLAAEQLVRAAGLDPQDYRAFR